MFVIAQSTDASLLLFVKPSTELTVTATGCKLIPLYFNYAITK